MPKRIEAPPECVAEAIFAENDAKLKKHKKTHEESQLMSKSVRRMAHIGQYLLEQAVLDVLEEDYESGNERGMRQGQIADRLDLMTEVRDRAGNRSAGSRLVWGVLVALDEKGMVDHLKASPRSSRLLALEFRYLTAHLASQGYKSLN